MARYAMIMAGGAGTRLWPMSRRAKPKQLLPFIGGRSLLELSASRLEGVVAAANRLICTAEGFRSAIRTSMPQFSDEQILGEPAARDTVNAVGFTAAVLARRDPQAVFAVLTADHLIEPQSEFAAKLDLGFRLVESDPRRLVTFSITPTYPATGFGYVERRDPIAGFPGAFTAGRFAEKPDLKTAESFLAAGTYAWNSGMFVFSAATFMQALSWYMPENHAGLTEIAAAWSTAKRQATLGAIYPSLKKISVDFAVMEPAAKDSRLSIATVPMNVNWMDVGSWPSYGQTLSPDGQGNRSNARTLHIDSRNILAVADDSSHTIATIGCENLIIVRTTDATLVCRADQAEKVKDIAQKVDVPLQ